MSALTDNLAIQWIAQLVDTSGHMTLSSGTGSSPGEALTDLKSQLEAQLMREVDNEDRARDRQLVMSECADFVRNARKPS